MRTLCLAVVTTVVVFGIGTDSKADSGPIEFVQPRYEPASLGLPNAIGEYEVLTVLTNDNCACLRKGEKRLILRTQEPKMEDALSAFQKAGFNRELQALYLAEHAQWGFDLVGPGITQQQLAGHVAESYRYFKTNPCIRFRTPKNTKLAEPAGKPRPGFATIENVDAGKYTDDNAQSVFFIAPRVGSNQEGKEGSALLNNVLTNTGFFLQVGLLFEKVPGKTKSKGYVVWADSAVEGLKAQHMYLPPEDKTRPPLPYQPKHPYLTFITFQSGIWWMCAGDYKNIDGTWSCHAEPKATGTNLQRNNDTSVFAENWNVTPRWYAGFSNPWIAFGAKLYRKGVAQDWSSQKISTVHACSDQWPPENAIGGSLANGGSAYFRLEEVPVRCE